MKFRNLSYDEHINKNLHITAHKKRFGGNTGVHFHEFFEIEIVLGGSGVHMLNGNETEIKRGMVYMLSPADFHLLTADDELELYNIMFDESIVDKQLLTLLFGKWENRCFFLNEEELCNVGFLVQMLIKENDFDGFYKEEAIRITLELLIISLVRKSGVVQQSTEEGRKNSVINEALRYIYTHLRENPPLSKVAAICNYTPNYFSKLFFEMTGKGYVDYLSNLKVTNAKMLLSCSDLNISQIGYECGFTSLSNFYRVFKQHTGETPSAYRKNVLVEE